MEEGLAVAVGRPYLSSDLNQRLGKKNYDTCERTENLSTSILSRLRLLLWR